jgi:hypothetical protein
MTVTSHNLGTCGLCRKSNITLLDSHYIPAAIYKLHLSPQLKNPHPIHVSDGKAFTSGKQASDHFLCANCEGLFNHGGESWVIPMLWRDEKTFPLRDALLAHGAVETTATYSAFEAAKIAAVDVPKLTYFAASIFWRGAAHTWHIGSQPQVRLSLGPYEEQLRQYLLGAAWPKNAALIVQVSAGMEALRNSSTAPPHFMTTDGKFTFYRFTVPGINFFLWLGAALPEDIRKSCFASSNNHPVFMNDQIDMGNVRKNLLPLVKAKKVGALADMKLPAWKSPWPISQLLED